LDPSILGAITQLCAELFRASRPVLQLKRIKVELRLSSEELASSR